MSLKDTIEGARREAEGNAVGRPKKEAEAMASGSEERKGFSRSSAAKARPVREAGASVRVESKPKGSGAGRAETKEEKKERKRREREEEDIRNRAYDLVLRELPGYKKTEKVFWVFLGVGMALAVISLLCAYAFGQNADLSTWQGVLSVASLVLAYAAIIGSFIYDMVKRRPFRKAAEARVRGLSDKKLLELFQRASAEASAKKVEKRVEKNEKGAKK